CPPTFARVRSVPCSLSLVAISPASVRLIRHLATPQCPWILRPHLRYLRESCVEGLRNLHYLRCVVVPNRFGRSTLYSLLGQPSSPLYDRQAQAPHLYRE